MTMIDAITHIITNTTPRGGISKEQARIAAEKIGELIAMGTKGENMNEGTITRDAIAKMFGTEIPIAAINLLWGSDGTLTIGEMRGKLREIAAERDARPVIEATQADRIAAAEVGERFARWTPEQVHKTLAGRGDECGMVQAFARHRVGAHV